MENEKLERLKLLLAGMALQAQLETNPKRKAKITENVQRLSKRYTEEKRKVKANHVGGE
jgi:hypothetical protein